MVLPFINTTTFISTAPLRSPSTCISNGCNHSGSTVILAVLYAAFAVVTLAYSLIYHTFHQLLAIVLSSRMNHTNTKGFKTPYQSTSSGNDPNRKPPHSFETHVIPNAFSNRGSIAALAKKAVGVYIFNASDGACYIGSSISLYNRVCSYFMPSILAKANRRVLRYFHKYGFQNVQLTLHVMEADATSEMAIELEQYFIDTLNPDLNVDVVASSTGYHEPMSIE